MPAASRRGTPCGGPIPGGWLISGSHKARPDQNDNTVDVVGHDDERIQHNTRKTNGQGKPLIPYHPSRIFQLDRPADDIPKQAESVLNDDGDEIRPGPGIE